MAKQTNFHFHGKFWINLGHFSPACICLLNKSILLSAIVCKTAGRVANSVDHDQILHSAASDLGLHCLHMPVRIRIKVLAGADPGEFLSGFDLLI